MNSGSRKFLPESASADDGRHIIFWRNPIAATIRQQLRIALGPGRTCSRASSAVVVVRSSMGDRGRSGQSPRRSPLRRDILDVVKYMTPLCQARLTAQPVFRYTAVSALCRPFSAPAWARRTRSPGVGGKIGPRAPVEATTPRFVTRGKINPRSTIGRKKASKDAQEARV
jgi:hypothetical protein